MPVAGIVLIVAVLLIVAALVYYLVATILALRKIAAGLDGAIAAVGEIVEKSAPVEAVVNDINGNLDAGWTTLELTVPAGQLKDGENSIALFAKKSGLEIAWMQIGVWPATTDWIDGPPPGNGANP